MTGTEQSLLEIIPQTGHIGAEIRGVDLSRPLDPLTVAGLRQALLRWQVVFFRGQNLDHAQHVAFARHFGQPTATTVVEPRSGPFVEGFPEIFPIAYSYGQRSDSDPPIETKWHADGTAYVNPPLGAVLRAETAREFGGDTSFASLTAAYAGLPRSLRDLLDRLDAVHRLTPRGLGVRSEQRRRDILAAPRSAIHPVVRVHPETGQRGLSVNPIFTEEIS